MPRHSDEYPIFSNNVSQRLCDRPLGTVVYNAILSMMSGFRAKLKVLEHGVSYTMYITVIGITPYGMLSCFIQSLREPALLNSTEGSYAQPFDITICRKISKTNCNPVDSAKVEIILASHKYSIEFFYSDHRSTDPLVDVNTTFYSSDWVYTLNNQELTIRSGHLYRDGGPNEEYRFIWDYQIYDLHRFFKTDQVPTNISSIIGAFLGHHWIDYTIITETYADIHSHPYAPGINTSYIWRNITNVQ